MRILTLVLASVGILAGCGPSALIPPLLIMQAMQTDCRTLPEWQRCWADCTGAWCNPKDAPISREHANEKIAGECLFQIAFRRGGGPSVIDQLLQVGADPKTCPRSSAPTFYEGAVNSCRHISPANRFDVERLQQIESWGLSLRQKEKDWLVYLSAQKGCPEMVRFFIERGGSLRAVNDGSGQSPIHAASVPDPEHIRALRILIELGANPYSRSRDGCTPYDYAIFNLYGVRKERNPHWPEIETLLGPDKTQRGESSLRCPLTAINSRENP